MYLVVISAMSGEGRAAPVELVVDTAGSDNLIVRLDPVTGGTLGTIPEQDGDLGTYGFDFGVKGDVYVTVGISGGYTDVRRYDLASGGILLRIAGTKERPV